MEDKVILNHKGLKCDHCDYRDDTVERYQYESMINRACPECGENLLTLEDYNNVLVLENAVKSVNSFTEEEANSIIDGLSDEEKSKMENWMINLHKGIKFIKIDNG